MLRCTAELKPPGRLWITQRCPQTRSAGPRTHKGNEHWPDAANATRGRIPVRRLHRCPVSKLRMDAGTTHDRSTPQRPDPNPSRRLRPAGRARGQSPAQLRRRLDVHAAAAVLSSPGAVASHGSAAALAGYPLLNLSERPCLTIEPGRHSTDKGVRIHRARLTRPRNVVLSLRVERTSSSRCVADIARESGIDDAVVVGDAALKAGMTDSIKLANGSFLPRPRLQAPILDEVGRLAARCDFFWGRYGVVGEADGMEKYDGVDPGANPPRG
ncbi:MAG: hypothetical protein JWM76_1364 [Pseudonocardiales bacterium]|nr:hypothetical protein [Pseudonocardiales bacterium]